MQQNFTFRFSHVEDTLLPQVSQVLKARTDRLSREKYPHIWQVTDRLSAMQGQAPPAKGRLLLRICLGVLLWLGSMLLLMVGLMPPADTPMLFAAGCVGYLAATAALLRHQRLVLCLLDAGAAALLLFGWAANPAQLGCFGGLGLVCLVIGLSAAALLCKPKGTPFDLSAKKLQELLQKMPPVPFVFFDQGVAIQQFATIPYEAIEAFFETDALLVFVYENRFFVLKKESLVEADWQDFYSFLSPRVEWIHL